eukprot:Nitzschia sp. Nitz4//scaffold2_size372955//256108//257823//NITZ4_000450-RA/size372955-processed-gene-0.440-mRNA-1//1//CDS//3329546859//4650//frame0
MTGQLPPVQPARINFAGMVGAKRRRMRSGGNVSTLTNNSSNNNAGNMNPPRSEPDPAIMEDDDDDDNDDDEKTAQTSKCKGATTIPIFLKKTYKMIDTCDEKIASWTPDGEMFVVKDPDLFASTVIPQYFDHNKFSSFARQLNFYGFRKMQSKPIRNSDFDANTAKHVTFYNENFKRGRCDLLKKIQRSTRGGGGNPNQDQAREVQTLKEKVTTLEKTISDMSTQMEERMRRLELDMLGRMEQMMVAMQQQQQQQNNHMQVTSNGSDLPKAPSSNSGPAPAPGGVNNMSQPDIPGWDPLPFGARGTSIGSLSGIASGLGVGNSTGMQMNKIVPPGNSGPTLPPHPKQKSLPSQGLPGALSIPPDRLNSLRGISGLSRGISGLSRGASVESQSSALLTNTWEDKFFSMLMTGEKGQQQMQQGDNNGANPMAYSMNGNMGLMAQVNSMGQMGS